jgi:flagellar biogenesis protein FliO
MVPLAPILRIGLLWGLLLAPLSAQEPLPREELIRSGGVSVGTSPVETPLLEPPLVSVPQREQASRLQPPVTDPLVQPVAWQDTAKDTTKETAESPTNSAPAKRPIPLARKHATATEAERPKAVSPTQSLATVGGSLAVVLALFFGLAWVTRRGMPARIAKLPGEVIEVLGKAPFTKGQELQMVRIGSKLLLLCVTPHSCETLTEINDPDEVDRLSAVCRKNSPTGMSATFDQMLHTMGREPARGFAEDPRITAAREKMQSGARRHA